MTTKKNTKAESISAEDRAALLGLAGFILYSLEAKADAQPVSASYILGNLGHDIGGMLAKINGERGAEFFSPRTSRYAKYAEPVKTAAAEDDKGEAPALRFMLQDGLDWVSYEAKGGDEERDGRAFFKGFHKRAPRGKFRLFMCHPKTKWDGIGGFSVPAVGGWRPVRVL